MGDAGNDRLIGEAGDDILDGGEGLHDVFVGRNGEDHCLDSDGTARAVLSCYTCDITDRGWDCGPPAVPTTWCSETPVFDAFIECFLESESTAPTVGRVIGRVDFFDAEGNELIAAGDWDEKRSVEPGATFTLRFFGPLGTTRIEVERMSFFLAE